MKNLFPVSFYLRSVLKLDIDSMTCSCAFFVAHEICAFPFVLHFLDAFTFELL